MGPSHVGDSREKKAKQNNDYTISHTSSMAIKSCAAFLIYVRIKCDLPYFKLILCMYANGF